MIFQKIASAPWVDAAEKILPFELPGYFAEFMRKYKFSEFEISRFHHYDNYDGYERWCWHVALIQDKAIFEICNQHRFLPIGQPDDGNYDRICLDINRLKGADCPVVQLDHEAILLKDEIRIVAELAPSYKKLIDTVLVAYHQLDRPKL